MGRTQDYNKSVIYHIRNITDKKVIYVGSTTNFLLRKSTHKYNCDAEKSTHKLLPMYCYIRENGGFDCFEVIPVSFLKLENKAQLLIAEQQEIDKYDTLTNKIKSYQSKEDREEYCKKRQAEFRKNNNEYVKQQDKANYERNKENKLACCKKYREEHKEKITEGHNERITCPICNTLTSRGNLSRHKKSKKCGGRG